MRVLVTHERFLPDFSGGCEYGVFSMAHGLAERGVDVKVLTTGDPGAQEYRGIQTERLPIHRYQMNFAVDQIVERARNVDLIQTSNYHASLPSFLAGKRLNKPVVLLVTALCGEAWIDMRGPLAGRAYRRWERFLMTRPFARIVFPSEYSRFVGLRMGIPPGRCVTISPGVELQKFRPAPLKEKVVLFVGRFERRKGVFQVVQVARALPDVRFRLVGWGPDLEEIRRLAPPNAEIFELPPGAVMKEGSQGELSESFARASIFFMPSKAESFGLVLVEAMASGCAVVSSVPLEYEGLKINSDDVAGMTSAIRTLWDSPDAVAKMGCRNAELALYYNWDRFTTSLLSLYGDVLAESRGVGESAIAQFA